MLNQLLLAVALVIGLQNGKPIGTATGFFYVKNNAVSFVTNRHVVLDEARDHKPDTLRLKLHVDPQDVTKNADFDIPLYVNGKPRWYVHKNYSSQQIDIAVLPMDSATFPGKYVVKAISSANFFPSKYVMPPGEDAIVIGFPRGLSDSAHNLPLIRNALVSRVYDVPFEGRPFFLIDVNLHPGMSGSPVFTKPKNMWMDDKGNTDLLTGAPTYFLGIHSATLSITLPAGQEAPGLGTVWYAYLIEEIIDTIGKP